MRWHYIVQRTESHFQLVIRPPLGAPSAGEPALVDAAWMSFILYCIRDIEKGIVSFLLSNKRLFPKKRDLAHFLIAKLHVLVMKR